jgi:DnaK suppressor protein
MAEKKSIFAKAVEVAKKAVAKPAAKKAVAKAVAKKACSVRKP